MGALTVGVLWLNLEKSSLTMGLIWATLGFGYLAWLTRRFRQPPPQLGGNRSNKFTGGSFPPFFGACSSRVKT